MRATMTKNKGPVYYGDYLKLPELLGAQLPLSRVHGSECHDETLFIIVHQVYELWFKQILHEMRAIQQDFSHVPMEERALSGVVAKLERVKKIQGLLMDQLEVMETMTPMDFLEFRDLLVPASGFQSVQFREIEILMGLSTKDRAEVDRAFFTGRLSESDKKKIGNVEEESSLLTLIESWLERLPFTSGPGFSFWESYRQTVERLLDRDEKIIKANLATLSEFEIAAQLGNLESTRETFLSLLESDVHAKLVSEGKRKLSQKATLNALFILLYRDEPLLTLPYNFLTALMDIDENFTSWRYRHAMMAHRMLGTKIGTGGSSGHQYLKRAAENNRVYVDLFNLSTFLIPKNERPELPGEIKKKLNFNL
jgi:tryptophan 2,3-dioxygenase